MRGLRSYLLVFPFALISHYNSICFKIISGRKLSQIRSGYAASRTGRFAADQCQSADSWLLSLTINMPFRRSIRKPRTDWYLGCLSGRCRPYIAVWSLVPTTPDAFVRPGTDSGSYLVLSLFIPRLILVNLSSKEIQRGRTRASGEGRFPRLPSAASCAFFLATVFPKRYCRGKRPG